VGEPVPAAIDGDGEAEADGVDPLEAVDAALVEPVRDGDVDTLAVRLPVPE